MMNRRNLQNGRDTSLALSVTQKRISYANSNRYNNNNSNNNSNNNGIKKNNINSKSSNLSVKSDVICQSRDSLGRSGKRDSRDSVGEYASPVSSHSVHSLASPLSPDAALDGLVSPRDTFEVFRRSSSRLASLASSLSDVTSACSVPSGVSSRETNSSRLRKERSHHHHCALDDVDGTHYVTPLQRRGREVKELRKELSALLQELAEKDSLIIELQCKMEEERRRMEEERKRLEEKRRETEKEWMLKLSEAEEKLEECDNSRFEDREELCLVKEELKKMDERYTVLKQRMQEEEEKFEDYYLDMYKKGLQAAQFEREEELMSMSSDSKSRATVRELTRKLSRTESELARWQNMKLDEAYTKQAPPKTSAEVTLSFLKDAIFHFLCDESEAADHLRAIVHILDYSDAQMDKIRRAISEERLFKKDAFTKKDK